MTTGEGGIANNSLKSRVSGEFTSQGYIHDVRALMAQNVGLTRGYVVPKIAAQMYFEEEHARAVVEEYLQDSVQSGWLEPDIFEALKNSFSANMANLVRVTATISKRHLGPTKPFHELDDAQRSEIRDHLFHEYIGLCQVLAGKDRPSRHTCEAAPLFYQSPDSAQQLIDANKDLTTGTVARLIMNYPSRAAEVVAEVRSKTNAAVRQYPTLPPNEIRRLVASNKDSYDKAIRDYASKKGLSLQQVPELDESDIDILGAVRSLLQAGTYTNHNSSHSPQMEAEAEALAAEAGWLIDAVNGGEAAGIHDPEYQLLKEGFQKRIKMLSLISSRAWSKGELIGALAHLDEASREALYRRALGEYLLIHAEFANKVTGFSIKNHPLLQIDLESVRDIKAVNPQLAVSYLIRLIFRNPQDPQAAIDEFNKRTADIMRGNVRLLEHQARRIAMEKPLQAVKEVPRSEAAPIAPSMLLDQVRRFLDGSSIALGKGLAKDIKFEIEERRPEIIKVFEGCGWTFDEMKLDENAQAALLKQIEEFIIASERAYHRGAIPNRVRDYDAEQRAEVYTLIAEEFARMGRVLRVDAPTIWQSLPVLYISAQYLADKQAEYSDAGGVKFRAIVLGKKQNITQTLERASRLRADLQKWYPGVTPAWAEALSITTPYRAEKRLLAHLEKITAREFARTDSRKLLPNPKKPNEILKYTKTGLRHNSVPRIKKSEAIDLPLARFGDTARHWLHGQPDVDEAYIEQFVGQLKRYVIANEAMAQGTACPKILELTPELRVSFVRAIYEEQMAIHSKIVEMTGKPAAPRVLEFGFYHTADYLNSLLKQYEAYFPPRMIVSVALTFPRLPYVRLNKLVKYRAELVRKQPDLGTPELLQALHADLKNSLKG